jgi:hypothetical protein
MQFIVPQFIDVEDKIIGPVTTRQFVVLLAAAAMVVIDYQIIYKIANNFWLFVLSAIFIVGLFATFAFLRVNGRPFHYFMLNFLISLRDPHLRLWSKFRSRSELRQKQTFTKLPPPIPIKGGLTRSKLTQLSLVVDTGGAYQESSEDVEIL